MLSLSRPLIRSFTSWINEAAQKIVKKTHFGGAYVSIEGPQSSTRAESRMYRDTLSPAVIGMTGIPEAKLVREAEMCYGMLALATPTMTAGKMMAKSECRGRFSCTKANSENAIIVKSIISNLASIRHRRSVLRRPNLPSSRHEMQYPKTNVTI